jgi:hypothetical protein
VPDQRLGEEVTASEKIYKLQIKQQALAALKIDS